MSRSGELPISVIKVAERRYLSEESMSQLTVPALTAITAIQQREVIDTAAIRTA